MNVTIVPFTVNPSGDSKVALLGCEQEDIEDRPPITYWKIYVDDKYFSFVSSKELAEKTKQWVEKWLKK
jgi:hypothetical protein